MTDLTNAIYHAMTKALEESMYDDIRLIVEEARKGIGIHKEVAEILAAALGVPEYEIVDEPSVGGVERRETMSDNDEFGKAIKELNEVIAAQIEDDFRQLKSFFCIQFGHGDRLIQEIKRLMAVKKAEYRVFMDDLRDDNA